MIHTCVHVDFQIRMRALTEQARSLSPSGRSFGCGWTFSVLFVNLWYFLSVRLIKGFPRAAVLSVVGGSRGFPLRESNRLHQDLNTRLFATCQFYSCRAVTVRFDEGVLLQVIRVLLDREDDALANRADGLHARVKVEVVFFSFFV